MLQRVALALLLWGGLIVPIAHAQALSAPRLPEYPTRYYQIYTDLKGDELREVALRMTRLVEEYHLRTRGFAGQINQRLPFYLFARDEDYQAAGGLPGSRGVFMGDRLMALAGEKADLRLWHVVQHEAFHQFAYSVIRGQLPPWVNEGLAEYFGESLWTGDGFVTGIIPPWRLKRLKQSLDEGRMLSIRDMMLLRHDQWNGALSIVNYDQAWSMVQFLAHGDEGKYQSAFVSFLNALGRGIPYQKAWLDNFGPADAFEARWKAYYQGLDENPTGALYSQVITSIYTSFLARATSQKQSFADFAAFESAAKKGELKAHAEDWLPPTLLEQALAAQDSTDRYSLQAASNKLPQLICDRADGTRLVGTFALKGERVVRVMVEIDDLKQSLNQAKDLAEAGKKEKARDVLRAALKAHPDSPHAQEARQALGELTR